MRYFRIAYIALFCGFSVLAQTPDQKINRIREHLKTLEKNNYFSGVVLIAHNGKTVFEQAYGLSNRADNIPNRIDTKFNLASMNKMFTSLAIVKLASEAKISVDEKVGKYLPDFPNKAVRDSVTIAHLLTHTSGMSSFWEELDKQPKEKFKSVSDYLPLFVDKKLVSKPGEKMLYSNSGYMVLGLIIEKISGMSYDDYVRKNIFIPSGMMDTDSYELDEAIPNLAIGYTMSVEKPGHWKNNTYSNVVKGTPAGGGFSTAQDLLKFANALQKNILLDKSATENYTKGRVKYRDGMYGFGIIENTVNGHRIIGHTGGHFGIANELMMIPDLGYTVIILTNSEVENYWEASNLIKQQLVGSTPTIDNFFYTKDVINAIINSGMQAGTQKIQQNSGKNALRESLIERYGFKCLFEKKNQAAIALFTTNVDQFPDSAYAIYNLAEAYRLTCQKEAAIRNFELYLKREPEDADAIKKLQSLKNTK